ncbi:hypothetical protein N9J37_00810 [Pontimonas sp.]|nr:hypothetical protein [Pontimonas sp.]MDA9116836.1 hypothetical protein [Pontimonas sp.]
MAAAGAAARMQSHRAVRLLSLDVVMENELDRQFKKIEVEIAQLFGGLDVVGDYDKYYELDRFTSQNRAIVEMAALAPSDAHTPVLDIGAGSGVLLKYFSSFGLTPLGLDLQDRSPVLRAMTHSLGIDLLDGEVSFSGELNVANPSPIYSGHGFRVVTAISTMFDRSLEAVWGPRQWSIFLEGISGKLASNGVLVLKPNRHRKVHSVFRNPTSYDYRIEAVFKGNAQQKRNRIFAFTKAGAIGASQVLSSID